MGAEKLLYEEVKKYLKSIKGCWFFKVHGSVKQQKGIGDIVGVYNGWFFMLELKAPDGKPTKLQKYTGHMVRQCRGIVIYVWSVDDIRWFFESTTQTGPGGLPLKKKR